MQRQTQMKWSLILVLTVLGAALLWTNSARSTDTYASIQNSLVPLVNVYKEVSRRYVDPVDSQKFLRAGIDGMLETLDPYTNYIEREDKDQLEILTEGKYEGVGLVLNYRNNVVTVAEPPFQGTPAARAGLREGDRIIKVGILLTKDLGFEKTVGQIRGPAGTEVTLTIERDGEPKALEFTLVRRSITVEDVQYAGFLENGVGYVLLTRFSKNAGPEVDRAIQQLKARGELNALVLDLRSNPGGMLEAAVEVSELFLPRNTPIVSTRGRTPDADQQHRSRRDPIFGQGRLVVLVNAFSASASEIVAGAIQDHDRGIIVGDTTFGKGLVQTVVPLSPDAALKITTAKYYTPSGRCIQRKNYSDWEDSTDLDAAAEFRTVSGRPVSGGGGIIPDLVVPLPEASDYYWDLRRKSLFFNFAVTYANTHPAKDSTVTVTSDITEAFRGYLNEKQYEYRHPIEKELTALKNESIRKGYGNEILKNIDVLEKSLNRAEEDMFANSLGDIRKTLQSELVSKYFGVRQQVAAGVREDITVQRALSLVADRASYESLLKK